jgi:hypothetical protein
VAKYCSGLAMFVVLSVFPAFGQYVAIIQSCNRDVTEFCAPIQRGGVRLTECIKAHFQNFTEPCQAALVRIAGVRESCGVDIEQQCPAIKPSGGRILLCVKERFSALSERCKDAIGHAAESKVGEH